MSEQPPAQSPPPPPKPVSGKQPFYAFLRDEADRAAVAAFAETRRLPSANAISGGIADAAEFLKTNPSPTVLFVEISSATSAQAELTSLANVCDPDTKVIVVGTVNEYSFFCWLMDLGISSYLLKPLKPETIEGAWVKATEVHLPGGKAKEPAKFFGFVGARGGVGSTTLALHTTSLLNEISGKKTAIVDLDPLDGSVSLYLDVDPSRGLREALERPDRIDSLFLDRAMQKTDAGFYVLSAEEPMHAQITYHEGAAEALLNELRTQFDFVIVDMPNNMNSFVRGFAAACETTYLVTDFSLQGLRDTLRYLDYFREFLRVRQPLVVANRTGMSKQEMAEGEFVKGIGVDIDHKVPFAPDYFMLVGGVAEAQKNKKSPASKALMQIVEKLLPPPAEGEEAGKKKSGLLKKGK